MARTFSLRKLFSRVLRTLTGSKKKSRTDRLPSMLRVEGLEQRVVPSTFTWTGATNANWSVSTNWSQSGPVDPDGVPDGDDDVQFTTGAVASTINAGFAGTILSLTLNGYTGTITASRNLAINDGFSQSTGTLTITNRTVTVGGSFSKTGGTLTVTGSTVDMNDGTVAAAKTLATDTAFNNLTHSGTEALTLNTSVSVGGALQNTGGSFDANDKAVTVTGLTTVSATYLAKTGTQTFNGGLTISGSTFTGSSGSVDVNGSLTLSAGVLTSPTGTFTVSGDWIRDAGTVFTPSTGTVEFDGGGAQAIRGTLTTQGFNNIKINKTGGTLNLGSPASSAYTLDLAGNLDFSAGAFNINADTLNIAGDWTRNSSGAFTTTGSTVSFNGSGAQALGGTATTQNFNNLTVNKSGGTLTVNVAAASVTVAAAFTLSAGTVDLNSETLAVTGNANLNAGTFQLGGGVLTAADVNLGSGASLQKNGSITSTAAMDANSGSTITPSDTDATGLIAITGPLNLNNGSDYQVDLIANGDSDKLTASGTATLGASSGLSLTLGYAASVGHTWTILTGSTVSGTFGGSTSRVLTFGGQQYVVNISYPGTSVALTVVAVGRVWDGDGADNNWSTAANWTDDTVPTSTQDAVFNGTSTKNSTVDLNFNGSNTIANVVITTGYTGTITTATNLTITGAFSQSTGTFDVNTNDNIVDVGTNVTLTGGTFEASNSAVLEVGGNWTKTAATFNHNGGTVTFDGAAQNLTSGGGSFNHLTHALTSSGTLTLLDNLTAVGTLTNVANTFNSNGKDVTAASLALSGGAFTAGSGNLDINGDVTLTNAASLTAPGSGKNFFVSGNWAVASTAGFTHNSGTVTFDGTAATQTLDSGGDAFNNLSHTGNQVLQLTTSDLSVAGTLTNSVGAGNLDADTNDKSITVTGAFNLNAATFLAGSADHSFGSLTLTNSSTTYTGGSGKDAVQGNLIVNAGTTFTAGTGTLDVDGNVQVLGTGSLTATSGTFNVGGTWSVASTAAFVHNNGTVTFDGSTATQTLASGGDPLFNLNHTGNQILQLLTDNLTVAGALTNGAGAGNFNTNAKNLTVTGAATLNGGTFLANSGSHSFGSLTLSNSGTTYTGGIGTDTILGALQINTGTSFSAGTGTLDVDGKVDVQGTGSLTATTVNFTVGGNWLVAGTATFTNNGGTVTFDGAAQSLTSGGDSFNNLTHNGTGTLTLQDGLNVVGALVNSGGDFDAKGQTVDVTGQTTVSAGTYFPDAGVQTFGGGLTLSTSGTLSSATGSKLDVNGNLQLSNTASLTAPGNTGSFTVSGNWSHSNTSTFTHNSGTVTFDGTGAQSLDSDDQKFYNLTYSGTGTLTLTTNATVANDLTISTGAGTFSLGARDLTLAGDFTNKATFTGSTGTVIFNGTTTQQVDSGGVTNAFNDFTVNNSAAIVQLFTNDIKANGAVTVTTGTLDLGGRSLDANDVNLSSTGSLVGDGFITSTNKVDANSGSTVSPDDVNTTGTIDITGSLGLNNGSTYVVNLIADADSDLLDVSGTATLGASSVLTLSLDYTPALGDSWTILTAGTLSGTFSGANPRIFTIGSLGYVIDITYTATSVDLEVIAVGRVWDGGGTTNDWSEAANWSGDTVPGVTDAAIFGPTPPATATKNATVDVSFTVSGLLIFTGYTGTITTAADLTINGPYFQSAGIFDANVNDNPVDVNGDFTLRGGTFRLSSNDLTPLSVSGDWTRSGGTFTDNNGTVVFDGSSNQIIGGTTTAQTFSDIKLDKAGSTLQLASNQVTLTVDSLTFASNGTLDNNNANLVLASNAPITVDAASTTTSISPSGTGELRFGTTNHNITVDGGTLSIGAVISSGVGSGGFTKLGTETLVLTASNTYQGLTTIDDGVVEIQNANALGANTKGTSISTTGVGTLRIAGTGGYVITEPFTLDLVSTIEVISDNNELTGSITLTDPSSATITLDDGTAGSIDLKISGTISLGAATSGADLDFNVGDADVLTVTGIGVISGGLAGSSQIKKLGSGTLIFTMATNTYAGTTVVSDGTLRVTEATSLGATGAGNETSVATGATLEIDPSATISIGETLDTLAGTLFIDSGAVTLTGGIVSSYALIHVDSDANLTVMTGAVTLSPSTVLQIQADGPAQINSKITEATPGVDTSDLLITGSNTVTLTNAMNDFGSATATVTVQNGPTLSISSNGNLGNIGNTVVLDGGTLEVTDPVTTSRTLQLSDGNGTIRVTDSGEVLTWNGLVTNVGGQMGSLTKTGAGTLVLGNAANDFGDNTTTSADFTQVLAGVLSISSDGNLGTTKNDVILNGGTLAATADLTSNRFLQLGDSNGTVDTVGAATDLTWGGQITNVSSQTGSLTKVGSGVLILTNTNTFGSAADSVNLNAGVLSISNDDQLGDTGNTVIFGGGTLNTTANVTTNRAATLNATATLDINTGTTLQWDGKISGAAGNNLVKTNLASTLLLNNAGNDYLGNTTINGGTLGGTGRASFDGTTSGTVTLASGATLSPGSPASGPGQLTTGNLTFNGGSTYTVQLNGSTAGTGYDQTVVHTISNISATATLNIALNFQPVTGSSFTIIDGGSVVGTAGFGYNNGDTINLTSLGGVPYTFRITFTGGDVVLTAICAVRTWDGGGDATTWADGANWVGDTAPSDGDEVVFTGTGVTTNNNIPGLDLTSITFTSVTGSFVLNGNALTVREVDAACGAPFILNESGTNTIAFDVTIGDNPTITVSVGSLTMSGAIDGVSGFTKAGANTLFLTGTNTFGGALQNITLQAGILDIVAATNLGSTSNNVAFQGGTLRTTNSFTINQTASLGTGGGTINTTAGTVTWAGQITGTAGATDSLTKSGAGTLVLANATNSFNVGGDIVLAGGVLRISGDGNLGAGSNDLIFQGGTLNTTADFATSRAATLNSDATIDTNNGTTLTWNGSISGADGNDLTKAGLGTLVLTASNGFGGSSTVVLVDDGTLSISTDANLGNASNTVALDGGTLAVTNPFTTLRTLQLGNNNGLVAVTDVGETLTWNGLVTNIAAQTGSLTKVGGGTLVLGNAGNNFGDSTTTSADFARVLAGVLSISSDGNLGTTKNDVILNGGTLSVTANVNTSRLLKLGTANGTVDVVTGADTLQWNGVVSNLSGVGLEGSLVKIGAGTLQLTQVNTFGSVNDTATVTGGVLSVAADANLGNSGNMVVLDGGTLRATASFSTSRQLKLGSSDGTVDVVPGASTLQWNGVVSNLSATPGQEGSLVKTGAGTLELTNTNTFGSSSDTATVTGGTLLVSADANLGDVGNDIVLNGGTLETTASFSTSRELLLGNSNGTVRTTGGATILTWNGLVSNVVSQTGSLIKRGSGTLVLTNNSNSFGSSSDAVSVLAGTVQVSTDGQLGDAGNDIILNGGELEATASFTSNRDLLLGDSNGTVRTTPAGTSLTWSGLIANVGGETGSLIKRGAGTLILTNNSNSFGSGSDSVTVLNGTVQISTDTQLGDSGNDVILNGGELSITASLTTNRDLLLGDSNGTVRTVGGATVVTWNGPITNVGGETGSLIKQGSGVLVLSASNSFGSATDNVSIRGGTLRISNDNQLGNAGNSVDFSGSGGTLNTTASITTNRALTLNATGTIDIDPTFVLQWDGKISGGGGNNLIKTNTTSTLLINNTTNDYVGNTTINGGTLGGQGTVSRAGSLTLAANATLSPGTPTPATNTASMTTGQLTFSNNSPGYVVQLSGDNPGSGYDQTVVTDSFGATGTALIGTNVGFTPTLGYIPPADHVFTIIDTTDGSTGEFTGYPNNFVFDLPFTVGPITLFYTFRIEYNSGVDSKDVILRLICADRLWDGEDVDDNNWMSPDNWAGNTIPDEGDRLVFAANALRTSPNNNFPVDTDFASLRFVTATPYTLTGNRVELVGDADCGDSKITVEQGNHVINLDLSLSDTGPTPPRTAISIGTVAAGTLTINGQITGTAGFTMTSGAGDPARTLTLTNNTNNNTGLTTISGHTIITANGALGAIGAGNETEVATANGLLESTTAVTTLSEGIILNSTGTLQFDTLGTYVFQGGVTANNGTIVVGTGASLTIQDNGGTGAIETVTLGTPGLLTINTQGTATALVTAQITGGTAGASMLNKTGLGTLTLNNPFDNNNYQGVTNINAGLVRILQSNSLGAASGGALGSGNTTAIVAGAELRVEGNLLVPEALDDLQGLLRVLTGFVNWTGSIQASGAVARIKVDTGTTLAISSGVVDMVPGATLTVEADGTTQIASQITGNGTLIKDGADNLTISGNNTYIGVTRLIEGRLIVASNTAFGTSQLQLGGNGFIRSDGSARTVGNNYTVGSPNSAGDATIDGSSDITFTGTGSLSAVAGEELIVTNTATTSLTGNISGGADSQDKILKQATGTLILSGSNSFDGKVDISGGVVIITNSLALGNSGSLATDGTTVRNSSLLTVQGGVLLVPEPLQLGDTTTSGSLQNLSGTNTWTGSITMPYSSLIVTAAASTIQFQGNISLTGAVATNTLTVNTLGNVTISGVISQGANAGNLIKLGSAALTLDGANTYAGTTTSSAGSLYVNDSGTDGIKNSAVTLSSSAVLGGNNGVVGSINATANSIVNPGAPTPGTKILGINGSGAFTLGAGTTLAIDISGGGTTPGVNFDQVAMGSGNVTIDPTATLQLTQSLSIGGSGSFFIVQTTGTVTGTFAGLSDGATINTGVEVFQINYLNGQGIRLTKVNQAVLLTANITSAVGGQNVTFTAQIQGVSPVASSQVQFFNVTTNLAISPVLVRGVDWSGTTATFTTFFASSATPYPIAAVFRNNASGAVPPPTPTPVYPDDILSNTVNISVRGIIASSQDNGQPPIVRVFPDNTGTSAAPAYAFYAYNSAFLGGVRVAVADMNNDGIQDIITVPGVGGGPHVKVFDGSKITFSGSTVVTPPASAEMASFNAYSTSMTQGLYVAVGDFDNNGSNDIVVSTEAGLIRTVRVFSNPITLTPGAGGYAAQVTAFSNTYNQLTFQPTFDREWAPYGSGFAGGSRVATGNIDGVGADEIITAPGSGGGPNVKTWVRTASSVAQMAGIWGSFNAYASGFTGGVYVAVGDINNDGKDDIITGPGSGGGPNVRVFSGAVSGPSTPAVLKDYNAYFTTGGLQFNGGVRVGYMKSTDSMSLPLILTASGPSTSASGAGFLITTVRAWDGSVGGMTPTLIDNFFAHGSTYSRGAFVAGGGF